MKLIITRKNFTYTAEQIDEIGEINMRHHRRHINR